MEIDPSKLEAFTSILSEWWEPEQFDYPWRRTTDPYRILISEFMLRKTTRKQVMNLYKDFFMKYPHIEALSEANVKDLETMIKPLGMYHIRTIALKKLANIIVKEYSGMIPKQSSILQKLPMVGRYIANAVLCLAYGKRTPLLDTNMGRLLTRIFSLKPQRKRFHEDLEMWKVAELILPKQNVRNFNLAILDFAYSICLSKKPRCSTCPFLSICDYGNAFSKSQEEAIS